MKKLFVLFLFASSAIFISCSSDDDNGGNDVKIIGKWEFSQAGTLVNGQEILLPYDHEAPECGKDFLEFRADNTGSVVEYFLDSSEECDFDTDSLTYLVSGNNLTITSFGETVTLEILTLNNNTLKLKETEEIDGETFVFIVVLTKV